MKAGREFIKKCRHSQKDYNTMPLQHKRKNTGVKTRLLDRPCFLRTRGFSNNCSANQHACSTRVWWPCRPACPWFARGTFQTPSPPPPLITFPECVTQLCGSCHLPLGVEIGRGRTEPTPQFGGGVGAKKQETTRGSGLMSKLEGALKPTLISSSRR